MLGLVPSIVKAWRSANAVEKCNWSHLRYVKDQMHFCFVPVDYVGYMNCSYVLSSTSYV